MERNRGLRRVLLKAPVYRLAQRAIAGPRAETRVIDEIIRPDPSAVIVDIGCGTADIAAALRCARYVGFDPNPSYVAQAQERIGLAADDRTEVFVGRIGDDDLRDQLPPSADIVMMMGVLHHLDDRLSLVALELAAALVGDSGRFVSLDPAFVDGQSRIARELARRDRGSHVRRPDEIHALVSQVFGRVEISVHHDLLRVPYTHVSVQADSPTTAG
jgi:SAM-dependent methyltransferase